MVSGRESGGSLFERIKEAAKQSLDQNPTLTLLQSLRSSLESILNTRSGSCYGSPELGLLELNDDSLASRNIRDTTARIVRTCILRYEPRIADATIIARAQDENLPLELCFHVRAHVNFSDRQDILEFDMLLDNHQHWRVE